MFLSKFRALKRGWNKLAMRLSWQHLPPLTTHALAFLCGTLFFRTAPDTGRALPQQLLYPADKLLQRSPSPLPPSRSYHLISADPDKGKACLRWPHALKLTVLPGARAQKFLHLPLEKDGEDLLRILRLDPTLRLLPGDQLPPLCSLGSSISYD